MNDAEDEGVECDCDRGRDREIVSAIMERCEVR